MTTKEMNKIMITIRRNKRYYNFRKKYKNQFVQHIVEKNLLKAGFDNYGDIRMAQPDGVNMDVFLMDLVLGKRKS